VTTVPVKKCTSMQACYMYVDDSTMCCTLNEKCIKLIIVTRGNRTPGSKYQNGGRPIPSMKFTEVVFVKVGEGASL